MKTKPCPKCRERGADTSGDNLVAFPNGHWHCFSCNHHEHPKGYERFNHGNESVRTEKSFNLPNDLTRNIPTAALKWLLQYGLPYRYWANRIFWSEKDSRLIFAVGEPTDFYIGRFIESDWSDRATGRFIETEVQASEEVRQATGSVLHGVRTDHKPPRKWYCYGDAHKTAHILGDPESSRCIVLVEDLLSASKISQVNAAIPLFGVNLFDSVINVLRLYKKPVVLWLDKDQGDKIIKKCNRINMLVGVPVKYVLTDKDPKEQSFETIKELLNE